MSVPLCRDITGSANQINVTSVYRHAVCNCERASDVGVRLLPPASQGRPVCGDGSAAAAAVRPRSPPDSQSVTDAAPPAPSITDFRRRPTRRGLDTIGGLARSVTTGGATVVASAAAAAVALIPSPAL